MCAVSCHRALPFIEPASSAAEAGRWAAPRPESLCRTVTSAISLLTKLNYDTLVPLGGTDKEEPNESDRI